MGRGEGIWRERLGDSLEIGTDAQPWTARGPPLVLPLPPAGDSESGWRGRSTQPCQLARLGSRSWRVLPSKETGHHPALTQDR